MSFVFDAFGRFYATTILTAGTCCDSEHDEVFPLCRWVNPFFESSEYLKALELQVILATVLGLLTTGIAIYAISSARQAPGRAHVEAFTDMLVAIKNEHIEDDQRPSYDQ